MEAAESIQKTVPKRKPPRHRRHFDPDFKLNVVRKFLEESVPLERARGRLRSPNEKGACT